MSPIRDDVEAILRHHDEHDWQVQGFGMLRTYLPGEAEPRLQVWDQRLATWGNNAIHDHPWKFRSTIIAGRIYNQRYKIDALCPDCGERGGEAKFGCPHGSFLPNGHVTEIKPGTRGGLLSSRPVHPCRITPEPLEVYAMGDSYEQTHREMHLTRYAQGTVTLIERFGREESDIARVAWYGEPDAQPPFVNPYAPNSDEIKRTIHSALDSWFAVVR